MTPESSKSDALTTRLVLLTERIQSLEVQVHSLMESQTVEATQFLVKDDRGAIRARLELCDRIPRLTFYDPGGRARLSIGLKLDDSPTIQVESYDLVQPQDRGSDK